MKNKLINYSCEGEAILTDEQKEFIAMFPTTYTMPSWTPNEEQIKHIKPILCL